MIEFKMPKLGESVTEGTIGRWLKQPGDTLEQYEPMLEVTTDKVDTEVSAPIDGRLLEILVPEGETVAVGTIIARLAEAGEAAQEAANSEVVAASTPAVATTASVAGAPQAAPISPVVARLAAEHHIDLQTIKGTGAGGRISKKDVEAYLASRANGTASTPVAATASPAAAAEPPVQAEVQQAFEIDARSGEDTETERHGDRETRRPGDTEDRAQQPSTLNLRPAHPTPNTQHPTPAPGPDDELVPLTSMRRAIAEHMVRSKRTAPHVTTVMEADLSCIVAHRERNKADFERQGVKLTFTPYFVQAVIAGLQQAPIVNASFTDDGILMHNRLNIGVAVAIPDGLIVPVIKDADEKSLLGLARAVNDLADRARTRRLQADDTQGGTFTITNHGVSGSIFAMPIINQPQSAILGVGAMQKRVVVISDNGYDAMAIRPMCYLSLTFDHRLIDGATADRFLGIVKETLEGYDS